MIWKPWRQSRLLLSDDVEDGVDQLCAFGAVPLAQLLPASPAGDNVVRSEELREWACAAGVHGPRLHVQDCRVMSAGSFVVDDHDFLGVLAELEHGEGSVVRFDDGVGRLRRWTAEKVSVFLEIKSVPTGAGSSPRGG